MSREGGELGQGCAMMEACVGEGVGMGSAQYTLPGIWARVCNDGGVWVGG